MEFFAMTGFDFSFLHGNGWVGVFLGLLCFGMGFWKGRYDKRHLALLTSIILEDLIEQKFIRTRKVLNENTGEWEVDILPYDSEEI